MVGRQSIKRETVKSRALAGERGQMGMGMEYNSLMLKFLDEELRGSVETVLMHATPLVVVHMV